MAEERLVAKANKDFVKADGLRAKILDLGFVVEDTKDGYSLKQK